MFLIINLKHTTYYFVRVKGNEDKRMTNTSIYKDITARTGGDIYLGVVGPVRTGKSTFIKRFMEALVLPNITDDYQKERAKDEIPQSAGGKTVMTTEPKFIPEEAVNICLADNTNLKIKMVDCVGYIIPEAIGNNENGEERMVTTPWSDTTIPFSKAAEIGTKKVISEHSTIGVVVTTDGSIGEIGRHNYIEAEQRVVNELKQLNKPFAIILNSAHPDDPTTVALATELEAKYNAPVALVDCLKLDSEDIKNILELVLPEFPVKEIAIDLPGWVTALSKEHYLVCALHSEILQRANSLTKIGEVKQVFSEITENENIDNVFIDSVDMGSGSVNITFSLAPGLYYKTLSELTGIDITNEEELITTISELSDIKTKYSRLESALKSVEETGYGIVAPSVEDLNFQEPQIIKQANGYGVKLRANAPSLHIIKANIETEINPVVGTEEQSKDLINYLWGQYESEPEKIWESNIFGKTMYELVEDGLNSKLENMPDESRTKLGETLERIINEGSGGLICIIL